MQRAALFIDHIWKQEIQRKLDARERIATSVVNLLGLGLICGGAEPWAWLVSANETWQP